MSYCMENGRRNDLGSLTVKDAFLFALFFLLAFQNAFQTAFGGVFSYVDEGSALFLTTWALIHAMRESEKPWGKHLQMMVVFAMVFLAIGLLGNFLHGLQPQIEAIVIDAVACLKFIASLCSICVLAKDSRLFYLTSSLSRFALPLFFAFFVLNQFINLGMSSGERLGYTFLFGHPTNFAATVVCFIAILMRDVERNRFSIYCGLLTLCATGRFKAIGFALVVVAMIFLFRRSKRIPFAFIVITLLGVLAISYDQIALYFFDPNTARSILLVTSIKVASMFAPFGSGLATFGSNASADYYPDFYFSLGFDRVYGLTPVNHDYLVDSFWPTVLGQCGYLGFATMVSLFVVIFSIAIASSKQGRSLWACLAIPTYLVIASTSEASIFASYSVLLAFGFALVVTSQHRDELSAGASNGEAHKFL